MAVFSNGDAYGTANPLLILDNFAFFTICFRDNVFHRIGILLY